MEVDNKPFKFILPFEVQVFQCYKCMYEQVHKVLKYSRTVELNEHKHL